MKVVTCEIAWHNKEPVYSLDFQHGSDGRVHRLATAGVDTAVRVSGCTVCSHLRETTMNQEVILTSNVSWFGWGFDMLWCGSFHRQWLCDTLWFAPAVVACRHRCGWEGSGWVSFQPGTTYQSRQCGALQPKRRGACLRRRWYVIHSAQIPGVYMTCCFTRETTFIQIIWLTFWTDAVILLWKLNDSKEPEQIPVFQEEEDAQLNKESWSVFKTLRYKNVSSLIPTTWPWRCVFWVRRVLWETQ